MSFEPCAYPFYTPLNLSQNDTNWIQQYNSTESSLGLQDESSDCSVLLGEIAPEPYLLAAKYCPYIAFPSAGLVFGSFLARLWTVGRENHWNWEVILSKVEVRSLLEMTITQSLIATQCFDPGNAMFSFWYFGFVLTALSCLSFVWTGLRYMLVFQVTLNQLSARDNACAVRFANVSTLILSLLCLGYIPATLHPIALEVDLGLLFLYGAVCAIFTLFSGVFLLRNFCLSYDELKHTYKESSQAAVGIRLAVVSIVGSTSVLVICATSCFAFFYDIAKMNLNIDHVGAGRIILSFSLIYVLASVINALVAVIHTTCFSKTMLLVKTNTNSKSNP